MGIMPAYGFFIRHVNGIKLNNVEVSYLGKEIRPAFVINNVKDIFLTRIKAQTVEGTKTFCIK